MKILILKNLPKFWFLKICQNFNFKKFAKILILKIFLTFLCKKKVQKNFYKKNLQKFAKNLNLKNVQQFLI